MSHDVYLYGMVSPSTVYVLRNDFSYPKANGYAELGTVLPSIGGEAANSAIVLARLGLSTKLDGNWVNPKHAERVRSTLGGYGIDVSRLTVTDKGGTEELVIADGESRTVFGNYATFHSGPSQWNDPVEADIVGASIVCVDPWGPGARRVAEMSVAAGKPYVTLDAPYDDEMAQNAAAIAISHELRDDKYKGRDMAEVFERYLEICKGLVIFTFGSDDVWFGRNGTGLQHYKPFAIDPLDTTGAGDSFRGALAFGLLNQWSDECVVNFASAVAACVCMTMPHALNAPDLPTVLAFIGRERAAQPEP